MNHRNTLYKNIITRMEQYGIIGRDPRMVEAYESIEQCARTDVAVLISGESGTGKELVAEAIHCISRRSSHPLVAVNLGAFSPTLITSELFGHAKGAFTGAVEQYAGKFEIADKGTLFLDEVSTIDMKTQISLLRVLETKKFYRVGGKRAIDVDVRIIAATNEDLFDAVSTGSFRQDLYYRLDIFNIKLPPLRERENDIILLAEYFLRFFAAKYQCPIKGFSPTAKDLIEKYHWPGNIRELKNVIEQATILCDRKHIEAEHLPTRLRLELEGEKKQSFTIRVGCTVEEVEREIITRTVENVNGNKQKAAAILGISRRSLYSKLEKYAAAI